MTPEIVRTWAPTARTFTWIAAPAGGCRYVLAEADRHRLHVNASGARDAGLDPRELADEVVDAWDQLTRGEDLLALATHRLVVAAGAPPRFERIDTPAEAATSTHDRTRYPHNGGNADLDLLCRACELGIPKTPWTATKEDDA